jgi:TRAP-type C4-dicarboxylate transport system permease large subunit
MNKGGIAIRLINFAKLFTGRIPGALAHTNAVANMLFGAISGSGTAAASAMGSIIGPIEEEEGYDRDFSAAANIATAPTGLLIPPRIKKGIASKLNTEIPEKILCAPVSTAAPVFKTGRIAAIEETARATAIGTPARSMITRSTRIIRPQVTAILLII